MHITDERSAIERMKQGDPGGLEYLVRNHQTQAIRTAYAIVGDLDSAQDVVQSSFLRAYECIHQFMDDRPFRPWFLSIVIQNAKKEAQQRRKYVAFNEATELWTGRFTELLTDLGLTDRDAEAALDQIETREVVRVALSRLAPVQRATIMQHYFLDMTGAQIAETHNTHIGTVKRHMHDGRRRLRGWLKELRPSHHL